MFILLPVMVLLETFQYHWLDILRWVLLSTVFLYLYVGKQSFYERHRATIWGLVFVFLVSQVQYSLQDIDWKLSVIGVFLLVFMALVIIEQKQYAPIFTSGESRRLYGLLVTVFLILFLYGFTTRFFLSKSPQWNQFLILTVKLAIYTFGYITVHSFLSGSVQRKSRICKYAVRVVTVIVAILLSSNLYVGYQLYALEKDAHHAFRSNDFQHSLVTAQRLLGKNQHLDLPHFTNSALKTMALNYIKLDSMQRFQQIIRQLKDQNKGDAFLDAEIGDIYFLTEDFQEAIPLYESAYSKGKRNSEFLLTLCLTYIRTRNFNGFLEFYREERHVQISFKDLTSEEQLFVANCFAELDHYPEALELYEDLIDKGYELAYTHYKMGRVYYESGDYHQAIEKFLNSIQHDTLFADAYYRLGLGFEQISDSAKAEQAFSKTVEILPNHYDGLTKLQTYQQQ